jgi:uroporphyrinogen-III synthase
MPRSLRPAILVTRPAEDAGSLVADLEGLGYAAVLVPMLRIEQREGARLDPGGVAGLLFTSANGVRAAVRAADAQTLARAQGLPVYAVGDATARAAREAGFAQVDSAGGDVAALAALVAARRRPADGLLLHVAGSDVAGDLSALLADKGFAARRVALYDAVAAEALEPAAQAALAEGAAVGAVFFSPRTARAFVTLATVSGAAGFCRNVVAYCLSSAVAAALAEGEIRNGGGVGVTWGGVRVAAGPNRQSLMALLPKV